MVNPNSTPDGPWAQARGPFCFVELGANRRAPPASPEAFNCLRQPLWYVNMLKPSAILLLFLLCEFTLLPGLAAQNSIPAGTVLPAMLSSSLDARRDRPGQKVVATIMQRVPLPSGRSIPAGAKLLGHVLEVKAPTANSGAVIRLRFDRVVSHGNEWPITADLRALASMAEVHEAQLPTNAAGDRGTSSNAWTTIQVGGDVVYRGGGPVMAGNDVVGEPVPDGVLARVTAPAGSKCRSGVDGNDSPQALWIFSTSACGAYGFPDLILVHAGRTNPTGEIELASAKGNLKVGGGGGLLLRVLP